MLKHAEVQDANFMNEIRASGDSSLSRELREKTNIYPIKDSYIEKTNKLKLPQFFPRDNTSLSLFDYPIPLQKEELTNGFSLKTADANITLE